MPASTDPDGMLLAERPETAGGGELHARLTALERENGLLRHGVSQLSRIRAQWTRSLDELKATKSRLQVSNQFLDRLLRTAPLPVVVLSKPWGRILMANAAAEGLAGVATGELTGRNALRLLDRASRQRLLRRLAAPGILDGPAPAPVGLRPPRGERRQLELHWSAIAVEPGEADRLIVIAQDITERLMAEHRLRLAGRIIESSPQGVVVIDHDWRIASVNPAATLLCGQPAERLVGQGAETLLRPEDGEILAGVLQRIEAGLEQWQGEMPLIRDDGTGYPAWVDVLALRESGELAHFILQFSDISERKAAEERLRHQSLHDALTGLPNRLQFRDHLKRAVTLSERCGFKLGVMFLDLDGFKYVNDAYGHDTGDELLKQVAVRLQATLRASDTVARFGGDEFAALLVGVHEVADIELIARKVIDAVSAPYYLKGWICNVSASIGVSVCPDDTQVLDTLMKFADMAMYRVKAAGKSGYQFFTPDMNLEVARRMSTIYRLQLALERGEFVVHYQPQVDIARRRISGFEALVRWNDPVEGLVPPAAFIALAEETGLINRLGEVVLEESCRQAAAWARQGMVGISMAVNLSARQFRHHGLTATVQRVLAETGMDPTTLVLEVTESTVMEDLEAANTIFRSLRALGVQFALDDFGTGYASMAFLKRLPFTQLKIDRQFVRDLETDTNDVAISDAIIRMAGALGLKVVAEGIESAGQLRLLEALKCDQAQGYYFARPAPADECYRMLARERTTSWSGSGCGLPTAQPCA